MKIQMVTPWYPDEYSAYSGIFVKKQVEALSALGHDVKVEVPLIYPAPPGDVPGEVFEAMRRLATDDSSAVFKEYGEATWVPAPVPARSGDLGRASAFEQALRLKRSRLPSHADVTHAHLGVPTGLALVRLGVEPLIVTEHQSTLDRVFAQHGGVIAYQEVVERASAFICVSEHLKRRVAQSIDPTAAASIEVVPNIVDLADIPFRDHASERLGSWLYVGTIAIHKGIELLLKSFKTYREGNREATLTIVGDGPHRPWVERFVAGSGISKVVRLVGSVPHAEMGLHFDAADVLIHLSEAETFGISTLEAIGAGLPVVSLRNGGAESAWGDFEPLAGKLLSPDVDERAVARAVNALEDDPSTLDPRRARGIVEDRFSPARVASALVDIYSRVS